MSFGSTGADGVEILVTGVSDVIRRATGCDLTSWPSATWQQMPRISAKSGSRRLMTLQAHSQGIKLVKHQSTIFFPGMLATDDADKIGI